MVKGDDVVAKMSDDQRLSDRETELLDAIAETTHRHNQAMNEELRPMMEDLGRVQIARHNRPRLPSTKQGI